MSSLPWIQWVVVVLMMVGFYVLVARDNLIKKVMGLNIFQAAGILLYVSLGKVDGGTAPVLVDAHGAVEAAPVVYSNPIPHVLMLTAIVVGVATTSLALALAVRIRGAYGTIEEDEIGAIEMGNDTAPARR